MIEGLLIAQRTLHIGGDPALSYTILVESTKQLVLLEHVDRFAGANLRGRCVHSVSLIAKGDSPEEAETLGRGGGAS